MQLLLALIIVFLTVYIVRLFIEYNPKIDIVVSKNKYIILLWYNKYPYVGKDMRTYKELFKI